MVESVVMDCPIYKAPKRCFIYRLPGREALPISNGCEDSYGATECARCAALAVAAFTAQSQAPDNPLRESD